MDKLILFITILAWVIGSLSTVLGLLKLYWLMTYTDLEKSIDLALRGGQYDHKPMKPLLLALICWTWIITFAL